MAAQQAAANDYQSEYNAPMVGDLTPSSAITQEYAKVDPVYIEETINFPRQFSYYRPIRGYGNCEWRAIGYSYFEKLLETGNRTIIDNEFARLTSLNNTCLSVHGGFPDWEDFAEAFINLLAEVADAMTVDLTGAQYLVHQRWNDPIFNNHVHYYLRMLVATHLEMNVATYEAFVADVGGIAAYCSSTVWVINKEIEHIGVSALVNILLKPVNFALQVTYLDLSPGTAPNIYRFPEEANVQDEAAFAGIIYTLFRPTHYDILYRTPPLLAQAPAAATNCLVQVYGVASNDTPEILSTVGATHSFSIAEFGPGSSMGDTFSPSQQSLWTPFLDTFGAAASWPQTMTEPPPSSIMAGTPLSEPSSMPLIKIQPPPRLRSGPSPDPIPNPLLRTISASSDPAYIIRFSPMQLQYDCGKDMFPYLAFPVTTSTFKNSVWNRAHFGNPYFHPEQWSPDEENVDGRLAASK